MFYIKNNNKNNRLDFFKDNVFDEVFDSPFFKLNNPNMKTDVKEEENQYVLDIDIPGFKKEDIKISMEDGYLNVEATKNESNEEKQPNYIRRERYFGSLSRKFYVGDVKEENIKANYLDGILTINVPKETKTIEKKYINIE